MYVVTSSKCVIRRGRYRLGIVQSMEPAWNARTLGECRLLLEWSHKNTQLRCMQHGCNKIAVTSCSAAVLERFNNKLPCRAESPLAAQTIADNRKRSAAALVQALRELDIGCQPNDQKGIAAVIALVGQSADGCIFFGSFKAGRPFFSRY